MAPKKSELYSPLWSSCDELRGGMDASQHKELGMSAAGASRCRPTGILNGQRTVTGGSALRLAHFFGTTPEVCLNLQKQYDLRLAEAGATIRPLPRLREGEKSEPRRNQAGTA